MHDFDVILGTDWLAKHYINLDCHRKRIDFQITGKHEFSFIGSPIRIPLRIISTLQAKQLLRNGYMGFLVMIRDTQVEES